MTTDSHKSEPSQSESAKPQITFPAEDYPIKVLGDTADDYVEAVVACVEQYTPKINQDRTSVQASRNGRFTSVTLFITATSHQQLKDIDEALKKTGRVKMVL